MLANAAVYPLDTVKTRLQAADADEVSDQRRPLELEAHASSTDSGLKGKDIDMSPLSDEKSSVDRKVAAGSGTRRPAAGLVGSLGRILTEEGVGGFYRGFLANMLNTFSMRESDLCCSLLRVSLCDVRVRDEHVQRNVTARADLTAHLSA